MNRTYSKVGARPEVTIRVHRRDCTVLTLEQSFDALVDAGMNPEWEDQDTVLAFTTYGKADDQ